MNRLRKELIPWEKPGLPVEIDLGDIGISIGSALFDFPEEADSKWKYFAFFLDAANALILSPLTKNDNSQRTHPPNLLEPLLVPIDIDLTSLATGKPERRCFFTVGTFERVGIAEFVLPRDYQSRQVRHWGPGEVDTSNLTLNDIEHATLEETWGPINQEMRKMGILIL